MNYSFVAKREGRIVGALVGMTTNTLVEMPDENYRKVNAEKRAITFECVQGRPGVPRVRDFPYAVYDNLLAVDAEERRQNIGRFLVALHLCSAILKGVQQVTVSCGTTNSCLLHSKWYEIFGEIAWADVETSQGKLWGEVEGKAAFGVLNLEY